MNVQYISDKLGNKKAVIIPIKDWEKIQNKNKKPDVTKKEILEGIKKGLNEVKLIQEGKIKAQTLNEFLDEL